MWTPNVLFGILGLVGLWRIRKPGHSPQGADWGDILEVLARAVRRIDPRRWGLSWTP
jgi:hypothetical protein